MQNKKKETKIMKKENNKIKRKFNLIDLIIILVIFTSVFTVSRKFSKAKVAKPFATKTNNIKVSFYLEESPDYAVNAIEIGVPVKEAIQNASFGNVSDIVIGDSIYWETGKDGSYVSSPRDGYSSISITMDGHGTKANSGVIIDKSVYYIGQTITLYVGNSVLEKGSISDIQILE